MYQISLKMTWIVALGAILLYCKEISGENVASNEFFSNPSTLTKNKRWGYKRFCCSHGLMLHVFRSICYMVAQCFRNFFYRLVTIYL